MLRTLNVPLGHEVSLPALLRVNMVHLRLGLGPSRRGVAHIHQKQGTLRTHQICTRAQQGGGLGDDEIDVAVFRFTLGIPGFDDRLIPRFVGAFGAVLLFLNHVLGATPTPDAQFRSEVVCAALAALCIIVPELELRLREVLPGRGRQKAADSVAGGTTGFFLSSTANEMCRKELAWASFALLRNTNCCGVLVHKAGRTLMARGAVGSASVQPGGTEQTLEAISKGVQDACSTSAGASEQLCEVAAGKVSQLWLPDRAAISRAGLASNLWLPAGAECALAHSIQGADGQPGGLLLTWSERPRALSERDRSWSAAVAKKLAPAIAA